MAVGSATGTASEMHAKWKLFVALGAILLLFGIIAALNIFWATIATVYYVGILMIGGGGIHIAQVFQVKAWRETVTFGLSGLLYLAAGVLAFVNPVLTSTVLTLLMAFALLIAGIFRIAAALRMRPQKGSGWVLAGGIVTLLAGIVFLIGWPINSLWLLGLFLAFDLAAQGWALIALGLALRKA